MYIHNLALTIMIYESKIRKHTLILHVSVKYIWIQEKRGRSLKTSIFLKKIPYSYHPPCIFKITRVMSMCLD